MRKLAEHSLPTKNRQDPDQPGLKHYALVGAFFVFLTLGVIVFASLPRALGNKIVVFVPPWSSPTAAVEVIARAGGAFVGMGNKPWIAIGVSEEPGFTARLYHSGAWFVGSGEVFSACLPASLVRQRTLQASYANGSVE
nr:hypothetical protein [uncultured Cohaesibacter sp.]